MSPEEIELAIKVGGLVFTAGGAYVLLKQTARKADVAHTRIDAMEEAQHKADLARVERDARIEAGLLNITEELKRVRTAVHDSRSEISGHLGKLEGKVEEMEDEQSSLRERIAKTEGHGVVRGQ